MKVLVTGDAGLIGGAVAQYFMEKKFDVSGLDARNLIDGVWDHTTIDIINIDKLETNPLEGVDIVVHAAAMIDLSPTDLSQLYNINVGGTYKLLNLARKAGVSCFIYISSQEVCWDGKAVHSGNETMPYPDVFTSDYAKSKALAEQLVISYNDGNMSTCSIRPCGIYGVGDRVRIPIVIESTLKLGSMPVLGNNTALYSHVFAGNVAHAVYLATTKIKEPNIAGSCYYIADTNCPDTFSNFVEKFVIATCGPQKHKNIPYSVAIMGGIVGDILYYVTCRKFKPTITQYGVRSITQDFYFSISKAENELDYKPLFTEEEAFNITIKWLNSKKKQMKQILPII